MNLAAVLTIVKDVISFVSSDAVREFVLGTYADGEIRSVSDMVHGEFLSPTEKRNILYGDPHKKKKKKKKNVKFQL